MHTSKNRTVSALLSTLLLLCALIFASCSANISTPTSSSSDTTNSPPLSTTSNTQPIGSGNLKVFIEPDMGSRIITDAIHQAQKSVWLEMYLLTDRSIISALEEAAHRNLDVRVMLETHPYGSSSLSPTQTLDRLRAAGVQTKPTSPDFSLTHEKGMLIDNSTAFIMTANFTLSALGGSKTTKNREYGIIDNNPEDVQTVSEIFTADWNRTRLQQINNPHLVVSPINSRTDFKALIGSAKNTLLVEAEEMQDAEIEQALNNAAHRGVQVQVILPSPSGSSSANSGSNDFNSQGISTIQQAGIQVKESTQLYMHAKIFVVDGTLAFVGSENISTASLNQNRELGILISDPNVLSTLQQTFQQDWNNSSIV